MSPPSSIKLVVMPSSPAAELSHSQFLFLRMSVRHVKAICAGVHERFSAMLRVLSPQPRLNFAQMQKNKHFSLTLRYFFSVPCLLPHTLYVARPDLCLKRLQCGSDYAKANVQ